MWTAATRAQHSRKTSRYRTNLTDEEWRVIEPHLPAAKSTGRPRSWPMREVINGIFYVMRSGCPLRLLPSGLPPWGTIDRWFAAFRDEERFERINHALIMLGRERVGREAGPTAAIIDGQSHLPHLLLSSMNYYNEARTHLSLNKDAPISRTVDTTGRIVNRPVLGELHRQYARI